MKSAEINALENESIGKLLLRYSLPAIAGMIVSSLYNVVDSIFIGRWVNVLALSALSVAFPLMNLTVAFGTLIGIGGASICSIRMGEQDMDSATRVLGDVLTLSLLIGLSFGIISIAVLDPVLILFGASSETLEYTRAFMQIILAGLPCTYTFFNLSNMIRASGYPYKAMIALMLTVACNLILAPVALLVLQWGIRGAAAATITSQFIGLIWVVSHFFRSNSIVHFKRGIFGLRWSIVASILSIGLAPFFVNICACVVVAVINIGLGKYGGDMAIGAYGIINRVLILVVMVVLGLAQGMQPISGYNFGAKKIDRVKLTLKYGIICGTAITTISWMIAECFPDMIISVFTKEPEPELLGFGVEGMRICTMLFPLVGSQIIIVNFFQSIGRAKISILLSVTRQCLFLVPALLICPHFCGLRGIWISMPISDMLATVTTWTAFALFLREVRRTKTR